VPSSFQTLWLLNPLIAAPPIAHLEDRVSARVTEQARTAISVVHDFETHARDFEQGPTATARSIRPSPAWVGLVHAGPGEQAGRGGERGDGGGGGPDAVRVGEDPGEEGADGEAAVAPEPVDADGAGAPGGVGGSAPGGVGGSAPGGVGGSAPGGAEQNDPAPWVGHTAVASGRVASWRSERYCARASSSVRSAPSRSVRAAEPTIRDPPVKTPTEAVPSSSRNDRCSSVCPGSRERAE